MANLYKKTIYVTDPATGKKTKTLSKKWYARYIDADGVSRRVALATDKKVAQKMLVDLIEKTERGITDDPFAAGVWEVEEGRSLKTNRRNRPAGILRSIRRAVFRC